MDEVDGMSGGDRGGVADLIETIKRSKVPVIAICNDKYHQKLKSLRNHCLELEFRCALEPASPETCTRMYGPHVLTAGRPLSRAGSYPSAQPGSSSGLSQGGFSPRGGSPC
jgi:hypothetical protein